MHLQRTLVTLAICAALLVLQACSFGIHRAETEAVRDYIAASELKETDAIRYRTMHSPAHRPINERFVIVEARDSHYLVEFRQRCFALYDSSRITPDLRRESNAIRRFDTIRGCSIDEIYSIDEAQALELQQLGDAPGDDSVTVESVKD